MSKRLIVYKKEVLDRVDYRYLQDKECLIEVITIENALFVTLALDNLFGTIQFGRTRIKTIKMNLYQTHPKRILNLVISQYSTVRYFYYKNKLMENEAKEIVKYMKLPNCILNHVHVKKNTPLYKQIQEMNYILNIRAILLIFGLFRIKRVAKKFTYSFSEKSMKSLVKYFIADSFNSQFGKLTI